MRIFLNFKVLAFINSEFSKDKYIGLVLYIQAILNIKEYFIIFQLF